MHEGVNNVCSMTSDRWSVCLGPSEDGLQQVSFVNGICTTKGGTHVDHVANIISNGIIEDMAKKIKLKPQQVKNVFTIFVRSTLENPTFSSQVKSECTSKFACTCRCKCTCTCKCNCKSNCKWKSKCRCRYTCTRKCTYTCTCKCKYECKYKYTCTCNVL